MSSEKTEEPTEHKLREARKKGQVARSQDFSGVVVTIAAVLAISLSSKWGLERLAAVMLRSDQMLPQVEMGGLGAWALMLIGLGAMVVLPVLVATIVSGLLAGLVQVGLEPSADPVLPNFDRIDPVQGFKRIFSMRSLLEVAKTLLVTVVLVAAIAQRGPELAAEATRMTGANPAAIMVVIGDLLFEVTWLVLLVWGIYSLCDWALQKIMFIRDQRMSKDEVKREYKQSEGDPLIKGLRRQFALEIVNSDGPAPSRPKEASEIMLTNPTHLAVIVRYEPGQAAPTVVSLGADEVAEMMRCQALESGTPLIEDVPMARKLFPTQSGAQINPDLYLPVAELLVWMEHVRAASLRD